MTTIYFVNWIDHAFENLNKLSDVVYKTDYKETEDLYEMWKNEVGFIFHKHFIYELLCKYTLVTVHITLTDGGMYQRPPHIH